MKRLENIIHAAIMICGTATASMLIYNVVSTRPACELLFYAPIAIGIIAMCAKWFTSKQSDYDLE